MGAQEYRLALVQPFDEPIASRDWPKKDQDLGFLWVHSRKLSEFIFVESIVQGALVVTDRDPSSKHNGRLVVDLVDTICFYVCTTYTICSRPFNNI